MIKRGFSFRNKLIVSFILVSLLPVVIVQMISYYVSSAAMRNKIDVLVHANLLQTSKNLDTSLQAYGDIVQQIITNDDLIDLINSINEQHDDVELSKRKLVNMLVGYSYAKSGIRSVTIFTVGGSIISYDRQTGSPYSNLWSGIQEPSDLPIYQEAMRRPGRIVSEPEKIDSINNKEQYGFHLASKINDYHRYSLDDIGVVVITVYESILADAINLSESGSNAAQSFENLNFLVNGEEMIVSSPDKGAIGMKITDVIGASTITNVYLNAASGMKIYNLIDQQALFREMFAMKRLTILTGLLAIVLSSALIFILSERLFASIRNIVSAMKVAQNGVLNVQVENQISRDEISLIASSFNKLMFRINELMTETKEATEKQKNAEIRALEAQINPHFLYNTLDSINWLAIEKDEHQISLMLKELAQILRYSIKDSNKLVTVREELEWMERYIYLQQQRFRSSFICRIHCPSELMGYRIPKLLLQPILENAIIHGFEGRKSGGELLVSISIPSERIMLIEVKDNGKGIDEIKRGSIVNGGSGIGLANVIERMEIYYKHQAIFELESEPGVGTTVRMMLPISFDEEGRG